MNDVLLIRHGVTEWNNARRIQGRVDLPLTDDARAWLEGRAPPAGFEHARWHSSPLRRATQTARLLGGERVLLDERLLEMDWGAWEGLTLAQMRDEDEPAMRVNEALGLDFRARGGESPRDVTLRLQQWFERVAGDGEDVIAVSHKGVIRAALALATGWDMREDFPRRLDWRAAHHFQVERRASRVLVRLVETQPGAPATMRHKRPRVLLHVQHLLGSGHTRRMAAIARELAAAGAEVLMASGGMPLASLNPGGARVLQLPPLRSADASYTRFLDADGEPIDDRWRAGRAAQLLAAAQAFAPHALLVETFPFGRRMLRFELLPLIEWLRASRPRARIYASVRDILEPPRKPGRAEQTVAMIEHDFDGVFVHGDAALVTLGASFPLARDIEDHLLYTGYVLDAVGAPAEVGGEGRNEVLVSAGGGPVGVELLECALAARTLSRGSFRWRLLVAPSVPRSTFQRMRDRANAGIVVERNRDDFRALLSRCRVSVSQAGYNTLVEALASGARVVAVPFAAAGEQEQTIRAKVFATAGLLRSVNADTLSAQALATAVDMSADAAPPTIGIAADGAATTARALLADLGGRAPIRGCNAQNRPI